MQRLDIVAADNGTWTIAISAESDESAPELELAMKGSEDEAVQLTRTPLKRKVGEEGYVRAANTRH